MSTILTVKLRGGQTVLAKLYKGQPVAKTFANVTQAQRAAESCGGEVIGRYPFFVLVPEVK